MRSPSRHDKGGFVYVNGDGAKTSCEFSAISTNVVQAEPAGISDALADRRRDLVYQCGLRPADHARPSFSGFIRRRGSPANQARSKRRGSSTGLRVFTAGDVLPSWRTSPVRALLLGYEPNTNTMSVWGIAGP